MRFAFLAGTCGVLLVSAAAQAQPALAPQEMNRQHDLDQAHSVLQKATLVSLGVTGLLGIGTAINKDTLFSRGLCMTEGATPLLGRYGCDGLPVLHGMAGVISAGLFIATEVVAESMPISPYNDPDPTKQDAMRTLRWIDISLMAIQPIAGLIAAYPQVLGIPPSARPVFSRVLRTVHLGTGVTLAGTYTANAAMQW